MSKTPRKPRPDSDIPYFDATGIVTEKCYVGRLDMMGARAAMARSVKVAGNFIGKLHVAILEPPRTDLAAIIPTIDGAYIVGKSKEAVLHHMGASIRALAAGFVMASNNYRRFIVRGGLAYGPVAMGSSMMDASECLSQKHNSVYRDAILVGIPVVQAYEVEEQAPPFGVRVHTSARTFSPDGALPLNSTYWRWWKSADAALKDKDLAAKLKKAVASYYEFMRKHEVELDYPRSAMDRHEQLANEYFASA